MMLFTQLVSCAGLRPEVMYRLTQDWFSTPYETNFNGHYVNFFKKGLEHDYTLVREDCLDPAERGMPCFKYSITQYMNQNMTDIPKGVLELANTYITVAESARIPRCLNAYHYLINAKYEKRVGYAREYIRRCMPLIASKYLNKLTINKQIRVLRAILESPKYKTVYTEDDPIDINGDFILPKVVPGSRYITYMLKVAKILQNLNDRVFEYYSQSAKILDPLLDLALSVKSGPISYEMVEQYFRVYLPSLMHILDDTAASLWIAVDYLDGEIIYDSDRVQDICNSWILKNIHKPILLDITMNLGLLSLRGEIDVETHRVLGKRENPGLLWYIKNIFG